MSVQEVRTQKYNTLCIKATNRYLRIHQVKSTNRFLRIRSIKIQEKSLQMKNNRSTSISSRSWKIHWIKIQIFQITTLLKFKKNWSLWIARWIKIYKFPKAVNQWVSFSKVTIVQVNNRILISMIKAIIPLKRFRLKSKKTRYKKCSKRFLRVKMKIIEEEWDRLCPNDRIWYLKLILSLRKWSMIFIKTLWLRKSGRQMQLRWRLKSKNIKTTDALWVHIIHRTLY